MTQLDAPEGPRRPGIDDRSRHRSSRRHLGAAVVLALAMTFLPSVPEASAAQYIPGYKFLHDDGHAHYACQREISSIYGPLWKVNTLTVDRPDGNTRTKPWYRMVDIAAVRRGSAISWQYNSGWLGPFNGNTIYLSRYFQDRLWIQTDGYGPWSGMSFDPKTFPRCR